MKITTDDYLSLVEAQHKPRPRFMAVLRKYLELADGGQIVSDALPKDFSLEMEFDGDSTENAQLDILGKLVGISRDYPYIGSGATRQLMTNDQYLLVIRAAIARNHWDGSFRSFSTTWNEVFAGLPMTATVKDNMDMSCKVVISGDFDDDIASLITAGYVFPKPMGVKMSYEVSPQGARTAETTAYVGANFHYVTGITTVTAIA